MKQLSKTVILTRHHLTPLANMDMRGSDHLQYVKCHKKSSAREDNYVSPISSRTLRGVSASCGGKMWDSGKQIQRESFKKWKAHMKGMLILENEEGNSGSQEQSTKWQSVVFKDLCLKHWRMFSAFTKYLISDQWARHHCNNKKQSSPL